MVCMPRSKSPSARTTLYRLRGLKDLKSAIRAKDAKYDGFTHTPIVVEGREALLVHGAMHRDRAAWALRLSAISGVPVEVGNTTAAAVLLIRDGDATAFALTYGMGFLLLDQAVVDPGFGMRVAIRTASPEAIRSLTRTELDHRSRTDRSSIPAGDALRGFGMGDFGEVITRLSAPARLPGLTAGNEPVMVWAADALSLPLGKTSKTLVADLDVVSHALTLEARPELRALEQFVRVKSSELVSELKAKLRSELISGDWKRLAIGWPHERIGHNGTPSSFRLSGTGMRGAATSDDVPTLEDLVSALQAKKPEDPLAAADTIKIQLFRDADGEELMSSAIPATHWLFYEVILHGTRYCLFDSRWYAMDTDYAKRLQSHVKEAFDRSAPISMLEWDTTQYKDEKTYNSMAASHVEGCVLDGQLIRTIHHPHGFEACDIITPAGDLIHVKHIRESSAASHLVMQVAVATDALRHDNDARAGLREVVVGVGGDEKWIQTPLKSVVLGMARNRPVTSDDLFSFTQVTVSRLDTSLAEAGIKLTIAPIVRSSP